MQYLSILNNFGPRAQPNTEGPPDVHDKADADGVQHGYRATFSHPPIAKSYLQHKYLGCLALQQKASMNGMQYGSTSPALGIGVSVHLPYAGFLRQSSLHWFLDLWG